ncbi:MAG: YggS family pyridoxal phosphate-dependent enzyme [Planctomycetaceae bacterium]
MSTARKVAENLRIVQERIARACDRAGRDPHSVTLVAVTKSARLEWIRTLVDLGVVELGESRPQQLVSRAVELPPLVHWHQIGSLQRNKVRMLLPCVTLIHSIDSLRLLEAIDRIAGDLAVHPRILLEVNLTREPAKHGFTASELRAAWKQVFSCDRVRAEGLMTMAAYSTNPENARPIFAALRALRDELTRITPGHELRHLSMGMSGDFETAVEEGATLVRVGSALWAGVEE